jgi:acetyl-CoA synthetase (ADP-forming)
MVAKGHELVLGCSVHEHFGPVLMLGLGGIFVEVLADVVFRLCPLTRHDAEEMLDEIRGAAVLAGARGGIVANREKIVDVIMQIGGEHGIMCSLAGEISELDVNPLIVDGIRATAVDARILIAGEVPGG